MAKKIENENSDQKVEETQEKLTEQSEPSTTEPIQKVGKYDRFEDIPESDREVLFNTIVDYSAQTTSKSIQRDTAIFLIYDKFRELLG